MTEPEAVNPDLIMPMVPTLTSNDIANLIDIDSPSVNCVKDIKVTLAGFLEEI
jgi:hypothetical protein